MTSENIMKIDFSKITNSRRTKYDHFEEDILDAAWALIEDKKALNKTHLVDAIDDLQLIKSMLDGDISERANSIVDECNQLLTHVEKICPQQTDQHVMVM